MKAVDYEMNSNTLGGQLGFLCLQKWLVITQLDIYIAAILTDEPINFTVISSL